MTGDTPRHGLREGLPEETTLKQGGRRGQEGNDSRQKAQDGNRLEGKIRGQFTEL